MSQRASHIEAADQAAGTGTLDQRRWPRLEYERGLLIHVVKDGLIGEAIGVQSRDFSTMGLGLLHDRPMAVGTQFLVPLTTRSGTPLPLLYTVAYCQETEEGKYRIGAELVSMFNLDEYARGRLPHQSLAEYLCDAVYAEE